MAELRSYYVVVREVFEKGAYVNATSKAEARKLALDTTNWQDCDDPMGAGEIQGTSFPVEENGDPL